MSDSVSTSMDPDPRQDAVQEPGWCLRLALFSGTTLYLIGLQDLALIVHSALNVLPAAHQLAGSLSFRSQLKCHLGREAVLTT